MAVDEILLIVHQVYTRKIMQLLPERIRAGIRALVYTVLEAWESIFVIRDPMIPRRRLRTRFCSTIDVSEYRNAGEVFLRIFTQYGNLKPDEHVLEIGSGCGRAALPLTGYLSSEGSYDGLEIRRDGFQWCQDAIAGRHSNFHFTFADVYNKDYNPHGAIRALEYRFPYADESFDFIFMTSVFTHMLPGDVKHYLEEIFRVLKQYGRCLITFFCGMQRSKACMMRVRARFFFI